ncbi:hypothetical protein Q8F55_005051 [Vanrija albida]|uniref:DUF3074 domain-containing protein n=1 Tax=Vanrija albida TaxID=181172 RepID=A0ABR3Q0S1_9TREE
MTKSKEINFNLKPLTLQDLPPAGSDELEAFVDATFAAGEAFIETMDDWQKGSAWHKGTVQVMSLPSGSAYSKIRKQFNISDFWCGRISKHTAESVRVGEDPGPNGPLNPMHLVRSMSRRVSSQFGADGKPEAPAADRRATVDLSAQERALHIMNSDPNNLYERMRRGLLEYNEREYIEACRETACLEVLQPHMAEIWRMTYVTPPPTSPRTFVVLLLSRELKSAPKGERSFMNISIPFSHPDCVEKQGAEKSRVRGKYVSVELVREQDGGAQVEWRMATSSDAGGNIPRFVTNASLPSKIAEDVPSFLGWMTRRFPEGGEVDSHPVAAA